MCNEEQVEEDDITFDCDNSDEDDEAASIKCEPNTSFDDTGDGAAACEVKCEPGTKAMRTSTLRSTSRSRAAATWEQSGRRKIKQAWLSMSGVSIPIGRESSPGSSLNTITHST